MRVQRNLRNEENLPDEIDEAQEDFSAIDRNQDGVLSMDEAGAELNRTHNG